MAVNTKNKYPADKSGTKYAEFRNTRRTPPGKAHTERHGKQSGAGPEQAGQKTA